MNSKVLKVLEFDKIIDKLENFAQSELGKNKIKELIPYSSYDKVIEAQKETDDAVKFIIKRGNPPYIGIKNILGSIKRLEIGGFLSPGELLKIGQVLKTCRMLKKYSDSSVRDEDISVVKDLISALLANRILEDDIFTAIISEDEISDMASSELRKIRKKITNLQSSLKDKLNETIRSTRYQKAIQDPIVTMRNDRYVIPIKQEYRGEIKGLIHDSSSSGATIFVEPTFAVDANNNIKQAKLDEQREIEKILQELSIRVLEHAEELKANVQLITELDFIFAKGKFSIDSNCITPQINKEKKILIKKGRHPLLDSKDVVPIDLNLGYDFSTLVVTGPNTGGKTVTLKTVGLFTLMTQAGLNIPCNSGTEMSVFSNVFADIGDEQSIEQSLSTFSSHMKNIVNIMENVDDDSLILFDELGAGTDPSEGAALAMSILTYLNNREIKTIATTHYSEIKVFAVLTDGIENASCEFNIETLMPTYKLLIGVPGKSNAFAISEKLGLPINFIDGAKKFLNDDEIKFEDMLIMIEKNVESSEKHKREAIELKNQLENQKSILKKKEEEFEKEKEKILLETKNKSLEHLNKTSDEIEEILKEIRQMKKDQTIVHKQKFLEDIKSEMKSSAKKLEKSIVVDKQRKPIAKISPKDIKRGTLVYITKLNIEGRVLTVPDKDNNVSIQAGIMKIKENINNLRIIKEEGQHRLNNKSKGNNSNNISRNTHRNFSVDKAKTIQREIDVRGFSLDDAIEAVDKYIDDTSMLNMNEVMIIHGKGTGVLRSGLQKFLKSNRRVNSFRLGSIGEGDSGVTVVELK
jgi:DNA mismatch repair protein MutS2